MLKKLIYSGILSIILMFTINPVASARGIAGWFFGAGSIHLDVDLKGVGSSSRMALGAVISRISVRSAT